MWRDFFYFSRREKQGIIILIALIAGIFLGKLIFSPKTPEPLQQSELVLTESSEKEDSINRNLLHKPEKISPDKGKKYSVKAKPTKQDAPRKYYAYEKDTLIRPSRQPFSETQKIKIGTTIELNSADTTDLKKIPGIGSAYAKRIVKYREILGGFYCVEQLQEVYGMYEELYEGITPFLTINKELIRKMEVNSFSLDKLKSHPYINFYQAKAIIELRKKRGSISDIRELSLFEEWTDEDLERLKNYLHF
ncbi:MAG: helix-hairpin-helix domain-containing protein [Dysgonamonadaceae bacterium]|jgi:competence ComEA-like helix-hairpin-helix protein|nr:helix-hairpin-helix domain-containing protein [Dysgonamonadaceae bacterium]